MPSTIELVNINPSLVATPSSDTISVFVDSTNDKLSYKDSAGVVRQFIYGQYSDSYKEITQEQFDLLEDIIDNRSSSFLELAIRIGNNWVYDNNRNLSTTLLDYLLGDLNEANLIPVGPTTDCSYIVNVDRVPKGLNKIYYYITVTVNYMPAFAGNEEYRIIAVHDTSVTTHTNMNLSFLSLIDPFINANVPSAFHYHNLGLCSSFNFEL